MLPLAIGHQLTGQDLAWLYQPYLALLAGMLALALFVLLERLVPSPLARAGMAALGAQPALLYGYAQWGGIKELAAAALLPLIAVHAARLEPGRRTIPAAVAVAALARRAQRRCDGAGGGRAGARALALAAGRGARRDHDRARAAGAHRRCGAARRSAPQTLTAGTELGNLAASVALRPDPRRMARRRLPRGSEPALARCAPSACGRCDRARRRRMGRAPACVGRARLRGIRVPGRLRAGGVRLTVGRRQGTGHRLARAAVRLAARLRVAVRAAPGSGGRARRGDRRRCPVVERARLSRDVTGAARPPRRARADRRALRRARGLP